MANRFNVEKLMSLYKGLTLVHARVLVTGATPTVRKWTFPTPGSNALGSYGAAATSGGGAGGFGDASGTDGVLSVTRTGAGLWTFVLQDNYQRLLGVVFGGASLAGGTSNIVAVHNNTTLTNMATATVAVCLESATATAADPDDGSSVDLFFILQNATVG